MTKLTHAQIPLAKKRLIQKQGGKCPLCDIALEGLPLKDVVLDHDHKTGYVRGALCRNCNGMEGQVHSRATRAKRTSTAERWVQRLLDYWNKHSTPQTKFMYPTHKTEDEKRVLRNKKARQKRALTKAKK